MPHFRPAPCHRFVWLQQGFPGELSWQGPPQPCPGQPVGKWLLSGWLLSWQQCPGIGSWQLVSVRPWFRRSCRSCLSNPKILWFMRPFAYVAAIRSRRKRCQDTQDIHTQIHISMLWWNVWVWKRAKKVPQIGPTTRHLDPLSPYLWQRFSYGYYPFPLKRKKKTTANFSFLLWKSACLVNNNAIIINKLPVHREHRNSCRTEYSK